MGWTSYYASSVEDGLNSLGLDNWKCCDGTILKCVKKLKKDKKLYGVLEGDDRSFIVCFLYDYNRHNQDFMYKDIQVSGFESTCPLPILKAFNPKTKEDAEWKTATMERMKAKKEKEVKPKQGDIIELVSDYPYEWSSGFKLQKGEVFHLVYEGRSFYICDKEGKKKSCGVYLLTFNRNSFKYLSEKKIIGNVNQQPK